MKVQALKFEADHSFSGFIRTTLGCGGAQDFEKAKENNLPAAYVVLKEDLARFRQFQNLIVDRGTKNKHKGLSEYLLGRDGDKVVVIDGNYGSSRQLERSIRTFFLKAQAKGELNLFIVGAAKAIFNELWKKTGEASRQQRVKGEERRKSFSPGDNPEEPLSLLLLRLMDRYEVPQDLVEKYVGRSIEIQLVRQLILHAARSDDPVLILGDTGTGKELVSREIHRNSSRAAQKFIPVNCGGIPRELFESELFGHKRGSFTDAKFDKKGLWEIASNGTLFLDEIADLQPEHQVKILRALEEKKIRPVGATEDIEVTARVIAATNRDLYSMVESGEFRKDLYYRLRGFFIYLPALKDHSSDIPLLAQVFWKKITSDDDKTLPQEILSELQACRWPGNARELRMVLSNLRALFGTEDLTVDHLRAVFHIEGHTTAPKSEQQLSGNEIMRHRAECLRHLRRVDEVLHAARETLRPIEEKHKADKQTVSSVQSALSFRLNELAMLTRQPLLFHSESSFSAVYGLKGKLTYFQNLLKDDVQKAQSYWKDEMANEFKAVMSAVFKEVERVLEKA